MWRLCYPASQPCVSTESKAFLCGIISLAPNLTEAAQAAAAPHFNMKVQNVFHIICSFSNACIFIFSLRGGRKCSDGRQTLRGEKKKKKKGSRLPGAYLQSVAPCTFQPCNFTAVKLCFCITVGEDVMLTYLCVLIAPPAACLTDCLTGWLTGGMTI